MIRGHGQTWLKLSGEFISHIQAWLKGMDKLLELVFGLRKALPFEF